MIVPGIIALVIKNGHLKVLEYMDNHGCPWFHWWSSRASLMEVRSTIMPINIVGVMATDRPLCPPFCLRLINSSTVGKMGHETNGWIFDSCQVDIETMMLSVKSWMTMMGSRLTSEVDRPWWQWLSVGETPRGIFCSCGHRHSGVDPWRYLLDLSFNMLELIDQVMWGVNLAI